MERLGQQARGPPVRVCRHNSALPKNERSLPLFRFPAALVSVLCALLFIPVALADGPVREPTPPPPGTSFTLHGICPFDVQLTLLVNNESTATFSSGQQIVTGRLVVGLENLNTHKSIVLNISGPTFTAVGSSTLTLSGSSLLFYFPGDLGPGAPGALLLTHGPVTITFDATGTITSVSRTSASATDQCAALSGA